MNLSAEVDRLLAQAGSAGFLPVGELETRFADLRERDEVMLALEKKGVPVAVPTDRDVALCAEPPLVDFAAACAALGDLPLETRFRRAFSDAGALLGRVFPVRTQSPSGLREVEVLDIRTGLAAVEVLPQLSHWRRIGEPVAGDVRVTQWKAVSPSFRTKSQVVSQWVPLVGLPAPSPSGEIQLESGNVQVSLTLERAWRQVPRLAMAWRRRIAARLAAHDGLAGGEIVVPLAGPLWAVLAEPAT